MPRQRRKTPADPNFEREAQKYDNPIPSREFILGLLQEADNPLSYDEIAERLGVVGFVSL